ncbi:unnamed protein product [Candidula unifasciata]|uniref:Acylglycerol kinase, mitochondrial n=1 Tax=Candidula unifasciata TaxID=100452 RepID=A0A8S3YC69_9EUPU|nr:unnamed protein product [Candidula unifasciata]
MSFLIKTAKTLRNHWKKSTFFFCVAVYGAKYANDRHNDNLLRRQYCEEAKKYGEEKIQLGHRPRRVTVFLNPAAHGGKARKLFEKTAAPILYLAGIEVNVVSTEYEGQVKSFMSVLDTTDTDAVVVAGGNGTVLEAVTGFLRKEDRSFSENIPLGVIPLGSSNLIFRILFGLDLKEVRALAESAIAVVRAVTQKVDVIKLDGGESKTIYAMTGLEAGAYRDAEERKTKYWYFGPLKSRWTYLRTAMKEWPPVFKATISYIEATEENMSSSDSSEALKSNKYSLGWSFVSLLFGKKQNEIKDADRKAKQLAQDQEDEKNRITKDISTVELTVTTTSLASNTSPVKALQVSLGPSEPTKTQLINEGWRRIKKSGFEMGSAEDERLVVKKVHIEPKEEGQWYNIDGESFEAMPVEISLLRNKLNFFCPQNTNSDR